MADDDMVLLSIHIEIDQHDDAAETGLTVAQWNALTDDERTAIYRGMWETMASVDNGGISVVTDGATGV